VHEHTGTPSDAPSTTPSATVPLQQSLTGRRPEGEDGMSTAEYAVGTVAACGFGAVLWAVVHSGTVHDMLASVLQHALSLGM